MLGHITLSFWTQLKVHDNPSITSKCPVKTVAKPIWRDRTSRKVDRWREATDTSWVPFYKGGLYRYYRIVKHRFLFFFSTVHHSLHACLRISNIQKHESTPQQSRISKIIYFSKKRWKKGISRHEASVGLRIPY